MARKTGRIHRRADPVTPKWEHSPETNEYSESWKMSQDGAVIAMVVRHGSGLFIAEIYPLGKLGKMKVSR